MSDVHSAYVAATVAGVGEGTLTAHAELDGRVLLVDLVGAGHGGHGGHGFGLGNGGRGVPIAPQTLDAVLRNACLSS